MANVSKLETARKKRNRKRFLRRLALIILTAIAIFTGVRLMQGGVSFVLAVSVADAAGTFLFGDAMPVNLPIGRPVWAAEVAGRIAMADDTALSVYTRSGRLVGSHLISFRAPAFRCAGARTLAYDVGGSRFELFFWGDKRASVDTGETIYCADLSSGGRVVIGGSAASALSGVAVYTEGGDVIFRWSSSELVVSAVAAEQSGERVAFAGISANKGEVYSSVSLYRIDREDPDCRVRLPGEVVIGLGFYHNSIIAVSDKAVTVIGEKGNIKSVYPYDASPVAFAISQNGQVGLVSDCPDGGAFSTIELLASDLRLLGSWDIDGQVNQIGFGSSGLFTVSNERLIRFEAGGDPSSVRIPEGILALPGSEVYYLTPTQIRRAVT